jgi:pyridoxal phosphate enzyme (YggS family)
MDHLDIIRENVQTILEELPGGVELVAAAKTRTAEEINAAVEAGIKIVGENYLQDTEKVYDTISKRVKWHFIGKLQRNKVKKIVSMFDMIETVDSVRIAQEVNKRCEQADKIMPVLIEVNSGRESQKGGIMPEDAETFLEQVATLPNIRVVGLMTMGPFMGDPEDARPYFTETHRVFEKVQSMGIENVEMRYLSMGMTNSYGVAIEEGANVVRIGTKIFGERYA